MAFDRNLVAVFTWNVGGLGPGGINQNGISVSKSYGSILSSYAYLESENICVFALLSYECIIGPFLASWFLAAEISNCKILQN
jgi:hypothetical protein